MAIIKRFQTITSTQRKEQVYADIATNLNVDVNRRDLVLDINEEAVKQSIRNILLTDKGERLFNPIFGSSIRALLFENITPQTESSMRDYIETAIDNFEPRANIIDIIVSALPEINAYSATIVFSVINKSEPITLDLILNRIR